MKAAPATEPAKTIKLHPAQQAFLKSDAIYRAFCGGIGSGKSWAGAYDLIRRAKPNRTYMVCAPTYTVLSDSTFRTFVQLAEELGIAKDVRRGAPPSVELATGAEVLFRSADEPDRLRGPNLSGVWLDEASLMPREVFEVAIGRLREGGEQGWLTATFTPKGRGHFSYETFATGRPDTAIFYARTADNPFLPARFENAVRQQYTSTLAEQELEGKFIDAGGVLFQRDWFGIVDKVLPLFALARGWDLAGTVKDEGKARDPDATAGIKAGKAQDGTVYILDLRHLRGSPGQVESLVLSTAKKDGYGVPIAMEQEPGSAGKFVISNFLRLLAGYQFHGVPSTGSKVDRALPFAAQAEGGKVKLLRGSWNKLFLDEAELFPFGAHDDCIDAATLTFTRLSWRQLESLPDPTPLTLGYQAPGSPEPFPQRRRTGAIGDNPYGYDGPIGIALGPIRDPYGP